MTTAVRPVSAPRTDLADDAGIICRGLTKIYSGAPPRPPGGGWGGPPAGRPAGAGGAPPRDGNGAGGAQAPAGGRVKAVEDLNLSVRRGEFFGLLGPNGAGKSTTIGMLTTRVIPTEGHSIVDGIDVVAHPALARTRMAVVTQVPALDRMLTVFDNLYYHGRYFCLSRAESKRRARALIERFRLEDKANAMVETLSGGLAQRVQIARALLHAPAVLFLDEPTAGLDPQTRLALWETLRDLNRQGQTILLTTHYMEEADQLCERIAIIDHGRLLALDTPAGLKARVAAERVITVTLDRPDQGGVRQAMGCDKL
ncbi:MAG TPA: ABC transporter ATP-binding protein [Dehalococcoidia bacterium]|nr:ABC transporter ATP-binding protein [Dehalococcoidia bacterium]